MQEAEGGQQPAVRQRGDEDDVPAEHLCGQLRELASGQRLAPGDVEDLARHLRGPLVERPRRQEHGPAEVPAVDHVNLRTVPRDEDDPGERVAQKVPQHVVVRREAYPGRPQHAGPQGPQAVAGQDDLLPKPFRDIVGGPVGGHGRQRVLLTEARARYLHVGHGHGGEVDETGHARPRARLREGPKAVHVRRVEVALRRSVQGWREDGKYAVCGRERRGHLLDIVVAEPVLNEVDLAGRSGRQGSWRRGPHVQHQDALAAGGARQPRHEERTQLARATNHQRAARRRLHRARRPDGGRGRKRE
mmetsp:Transcript_41447/g.128876  ORF Transcript_41447/g.128876 Transcript_41447/m.128876 type:complete len:303 (-) Transcript_41447:9-917(-)